MKDTSNIRLGGELTWTSHGVQDSSACEGTLEELRAWVAADVPAEHKLDVDAFGVWLLDGGEVVPNLEDLRQVLVLETAAGYVVAKFGPESRRRRPARAQAVDVRWKNPLSSGRERVAQRRWGLARRIANVAGIADRTYVQMYLDRAFAADPGADLHKLWLLPLDHFTARLGLVQVVIDRRPRTG